ncbi:prepilin-type N-terminal cleavage/methylation domain-containing protein [Clostridium chromiireducens]|uniref:Prepilin-type N-terminal cleavage/methylation domain-containing protein n=1 Tax=Clostridium chromiireducens TaxID=225345 RepID=A0A399IT37_9CLOT|nr:prepilin-type N-terminal cleavage/methylation domain-containing protein [Clostridium chromiireducens]RII36130.1 prepilin-type N-terminal cleavage/methylation domain-containing protein [Clostridium chromiireducens]
MINLSIRKKNELTKKKKKGFTLIELIIVIAIIAILAAIAIPRFGAIRESGNVKSDIATAKNIQTAVSTAISNGDITLDSSGDNSSFSLATIMDGNIPKAKAQGFAGQSFTATVDNNQVIVKIGSTEILPVPASSTYSSVLS